MRTFDGPVPIDILYFRIAGVKNITSMPLCECTLGIEGAVRFNHERSSETSVVFSEICEKGKSYEVSRAALKAGLQKEIYGDKFKIMDFVIQPGGEMLTAEVSEFIQRYS